MARNTRSTTLHPQEEKNSVVAYDDAMEQRKGNLLYLEDVCYDPIDRLVGLLEEHPSSEEIKCLLLSILSQGKVEALKTSLITFDASKHTASTASTEDTDSESNRLETQSTRKTASSRRLVAHPGTRTVRQRPTVQRSNSEHRLRTYSGTGIRAAHQNFRQNTSSNERWLDTSMKSSRRERGSLSRRETSPMPPTQKAIPKDDTGESNELVGSRQVSESTTTHCDGGTSIRSKTGSSSGNQRLTRSRSGDLMQRNSVNVKQRRSRSNEREIVSKALNLAIQNKPVGLSLSTHTTHATKSCSSIDTNQRLSASLHHNSGLRSTNQNGCSSRFIHGSRPSHPTATRYGNRVLEGAGAASAKADQPTLTSDDSGSSSHSKHSTDTCIQFHPDGIQEIDVGKSQPDETNNTLKKSEFNCITNNKMESKEKKGIYGFLIRQLSKEKLIDKRTHSNVNESDIESSSDDSSDDSSFCL
jgi:hypothetical protein